MKKRRSEPAAVERLLADLWRERDAVAFALLAAEDVYMRCVGNVGPNDPLTRRAWTAVFAGTSALTQLESVLADATAVAAEECGDDFVAALVREMTSPTSPTTPTHSLGGDPQ